MILGRPFFQAAYAYVDETGQIFLTAANQYKLEIFALPFQANQTLEIPASPTPTQPAPSPTKKSVAPPQAKLNGSVLAFMAFWVLVSQFVTQ